MNALLLALAAGLAPAADPPPTHADVTYGPHPHQRIDVYPPIATPSCSAPTPRYTSSPCSRSRWYPSLP